MATDEIVDRLYGLPRAEFTSARDEAAKELRRAGRREEADRVKGLRKPTAAADAVNRLVRRFPRDVEEFLAAAATLRDAQVAGKGDARAAGQRERELLDRLVGLGGSAVRQTLEAAAVDDDVAREVLAARLEQEPEPPGLGTLLAHAVPAPTGPAAPKRAQPAAPRRKEEIRPAAWPKPPDDTAARAKLREAKERYTEAAAEERRARRYLTKSQRDLERAQAAVDRAEHQLARLHGRVSQERG